MEEGTIGDGGWRGGGGPFFLWVYSGWNILGVLRITYIGYVTHGHAYVTHGHILFHSYRVFSFVVATTSGYAWNLKHDYLFKMQERLKSTLYSIQTMQNMLKFSVKNTFLKQQADENTKTNW